MPRDKTKVYKILCAWVLALHLAWIDLFMWEGSVTLIMQISSRDNA